MLELLFERLDFKDNLLSDLSKRKAVALFGCVKSQTEHLLTGLGAGFKYRLVVTYDERKARDMLEDFLAFSGACVYYPALDPMFYKADVRGNYVTGLRTEIVKQIYEGKPLTIITCPEAFRDLLVSFEDIKKRSITVNKGDSVDIPALKERLVSLGYSNETQVAGHGEFSVRGNIIDIFPHAQDAPFRIDLWGDTVESIKLFDAESQRSVEEVGSLTVFSGGDEPREGAGSVGFLDYFDPKETLLVIDEPQKVFERAASFDVLSENGEEGEPKTRGQLCDIQGFGKMNGFARIYLMPFEGAGAKAPYDVSYSINARSVPSYNGRFSDLISDLIKYKDGGWDVTICAASPLRAERLREDIMAAGAGALVTVGAVRSGFEYPDLKISLISDVDIYGNRHIKRRPKKRYTGDVIKSFTDLNIGDFVVHEQHGIGVYEGIERIETDGTQRDYMKIRYAGGSNLFVLATQFERIQKYSGKDGKEPKLSKLGGKEWINTKAKTRAAVKDIAADLVRLYAERQMKKGFVYGPDTVWQKEFEDSFEFEETSDQLRAVEDIKADMESPKIMDRLICGDVGFGKTEVALRAAFKAVQEGKQVAFLAPTTILVKQHFDTAKKRMAQYPVNIRMLSRFSSRAQTNETLRQLKNGGADIVVGTHRLLSADVEFKNLGLLIIDEEQRFGVSHKEKIKRLKKDVDVLALSATPIPRTLHMSLSGIRDMSVLSEPPLERLPIQTYVMEYSDAAVREAILRESASGGQTYYVYNRIDDIEAVCARIKSMVPTLNVQYAHGRMPAKELENIMADYVEGDIDVLVSTTIIESGLDIPNVNTIIVHDADRFGLSQLYQLRGRVGRSNRMAYAFLMYRKDKILREEATKRLKAIREFSELGSGIKIALSDLEIRGAGNVLGAEQSGHMEAVGYELYSKMLSEAVSLLKGESPEEDYETSVDLKINAYIPSEYIMNSYDKLNMYKKISQIESEQDAEDIRAELKDRFGEIPKVTENLLDVAYLKSMAHKRYVTEISGGKKGYNISMLLNAKIDTSKIAGFLEHNKDHVRFVTGAKPAFLLTPSKEQESVKDIMDTIMPFLESMDEIMEGGDERDPSLRSG